MGLDQPLTAELVIKVLFAIAAGLTSLAGACWVVLQMVERSGLLRGREKRHDAVDASSTESALKMLGETRLELERAYAKISALEDRNSALEEKNNDGIQKALALTRELTIAKGNVERLNMTLQLVKKAETDLIEADQLGDRLVDGLTNIIVETSRNDPP